MGDVVDIELSVRKKEVSFSVAGVVLARGKWQSSSPCLCIFNFYSENRVRIVSTPVNERLPV